MRAHALEHTPSARAHTHRQNFFTKCFTSFALITNRISFAVFTFASRFFFFFQIHTHTHWIVFSQYTSRLFSTLFRFFFAFKLYYLFLWNISAMNVIASEVLFSRAHVQVLNFMKEIRKNNGRMCFIPSNCHNISTVTNQLHLYIFFSSFTSCNSHQQVQRWVI